MNGKFTCSLCLGNCPLCHCGTDSGGKYQRNGVPRINEYIREPLCYHWKRVFCFRNLEEYIVISEVLELKHLK